MTPEQEKLYKRTLPKPKIMPHKYKTEKTLCDHDLVTKKNGNKMCTSCWSEYEPGTI